MAEKGKKNIPLFPRLPDSSCLVCPLPALYHCQLQISWPVPCSGESLSLGQPWLSQSRGSSCRDLGWALQDTVREMLLQSPTQSSNRCKPPRFPDFPSPAQVPEPSVAVPALPRAAHTFQVQAVAEQDSTSQPSAWQSLPAVILPPRGAEQVEGWAQREWALPSHSPLCRAPPPTTERQENKQLGREVVWTELDWSNLPAQTWAGSCSGEDKRTHLP